MRRAAISALLVDPDGAIVTEHDRANALADGLGPCDRVDAVASTSPVLVAASTPVTEAAAIMLHQGVRHLIVGRPGGGAGIVALPDVTAVLLQATRPELWLTSLRMAFSPAAEVWLG